MDRAEIIRLAPYDWRNTIIAILAWVLIVVSVGLVFAVHKITTEPTPYQTRAEADAQFIQLRSDTTYLRRLLDTTAEELRRRINLDADNQGAINIGLTNDIATIDERMDAIEQYLATSPSTKRFKPRPRQKKSTP